MTSDKLVINPEASAVPPNSRVGRTPRTGVRVRSPMSWRAGYSGRQAVAWFVNAPLHAPSGGAPLRALRRPWPRLRTPSRAATGSWMNTVARPRNSGPVSLPIVGPVTWEDVRRAAFRALQQPLNDRPKVWARVLRRVACSLRPARHRARHRRSRACPRAERYAARRQDAPAVSRDPARAVSGTRG